MACFFVHCLPHNTLCDGWQKAAPDWAIVGGFPVFLLTLRFSKSVKAESKILSTSELWPYKLAYGSIWASKFVLFLTWSVGVSETCIAFGKGWNVLKFRKNLLCIWLRSTQ